MINRINSPEEFNKLIKISKFRVWILLLLILISIVIGIIWFVKSEVVIEERHPLYISNDVSKLGDLIYRTVYQELKNENLAKEWVKEMEDIYGSDFINKDIYPACLFIDDSSKTEMVDQMEIIASDYKGIVLFIPFETYDYKKLFNNIEFTDEEMRKVGMNPGIKYSPIIVAIWANQVNENVKPGLYNSSVILDVLKPITMIFK